MTRAPRWRPSSQRACTQASPALAIATDPHRFAICRRLAADGIDVHGACEDASLTLLDASETLAGIMVDGMPEPSRFEETVGRLVANMAAARPHTHLHAYGEMVDVHDLRRRFTFSLGLATGDPERYLTSLRLVLASGERMARMIEQLLDFTRARVGAGIQIGPRTADFDDLCRQVVRDTEHAHPDWRVSWRTAGNTVGRWDVDRMMQVLSNLVGNAVQHGDQAAGVTIAVDGRDEHRLVIDVHDKGRIPDAMLPTLFDSFHGSRPGSRGLGLGLFITKQIVVAHGGSVDVETSDAAGTTFTIRLPRRASVCLP
jgi:signal transduction histidine kinase